MAELFDEFPYLESETLIIRKMTTEDIDALTEMTENERVYRYIPPFLYKKSRGNLLAAIRNIGGRDFDKKKMLIAGIYQKSEPDRLVGMAEIFDHKRRSGSVTIGCRVNESYWNRGIATKTVEMLLKFLWGCQDVKTVKAFVMPENVYSSRALMKNGFLREPLPAEGKNWGGRETVELYEYTCLPPVSRQ